MHDSDQLEYTQFMQSEDTLGSFCLKESQQSSTGESALREIDNGCEIEVSLTK